VNFSSQKGRLLLLISIAVLLLIVLVWQFSPGGDRAIRMGFTPVNEQMQKLIDQTAEKAAPGESGVSVRGPGNSGTPKDAKADPEQKKDPTVTDAAGPKSTASPTSSATAKPYSPAASPKKASTGANERIELNAATLEQLDSLPGIGESKAKAILAYRLEKGSFKQIEDLKEVKGIGEKMLEKLKPFVYIAQP
jgi:competence protein ComEA